MHNLRGSTYLLGGVNDPQAVAVLEEAQHRSEDREDQCSCEVLGQEAQNNLIIWSQQCPKVGEGCIPSLSQGTVLPSWLGQWHPGMLLQQHGWLALPKEEGKPLGTGKIRHPGQSGVAPQ